jgi:uncharacterized protein (TIGR02600 family)
MKNRTQGVAIVVVLGMLVLLSVIVVAFLSSVRTELTASKSYESQGNARILADSALNLVITQIRSASTSSSTAWISQPGLIRTFDTSGNPVKAFKLYSADQMIVTGVFDPAAGADLPPANWSQQPGLYTDLNQPISDPTRIDPTTKAASLVYPILDGNSIVDDGSGTGTGIIGTTGTTTSEVEGFKILNYSTNKVAMPVKWLYMLKDGTLLPATTASGSSVTVAAAGGVSASGSNPIIARVAFWTDDETTKVNINTASEGTFWDTPVCNTQSGNDISNPSNAAPFNNDSFYEWDLGERMGAQNEYQRYPGHPATTCLSTVLGSSIQKALGLSDLTGANRATFVKAITDLTPRTLDDPSTTSLGGTQRAGGIASSKSNRLYASVDELLYDINRNLNYTLSSSDVRSTIEKAKFFLTANSHAPEQNLFNKPRVAIWPVNVNSGNRTKFDNLIAFCSTIGSGGSQKPFYFTRQDPTSSTVDWSARNQAIYNYLHQLTGSPIPGFGGNFQSKYGADGDQILTEIFDYIRCANLVDNSAGATPFTSLADGTTGLVPSGKPAQGEVVPIELPNGTRGFGRIPTISELALVILKIDNRKDQTIQDSGTNQLTDSLSTFDPTKQTMLEFALVPQLFCPMAGYVQAANNIKIEFTGCNFTVTDKAGGAQNPFTAPPFSSGSTSQPSLYDIGRVSRPQNSDTKMGGYIGVRSLMEWSKSSTIPGSPSDSVPPNGDVIVSGTALYKAPVDSITISGTATVSIRAPYSGPVIQTLSFVFPSQQVPIPSLAYGHTSPATYQWEGQFGGPYTKTDGSAKLGTVLLHTASRIKGARCGYDVVGENAAVWPGDTVRSVAATGNSINGDMRLVAALHTVDSGYFQPQASYSGSTNALSFSFYTFEPRGQVQYSSGFGLPAFPNAGGDATYGYLVPSLVRSSAPNTYFAPCTPPLPENVKGAFLSTGQPGDWDNGPGLLCDGPYLNKADEGCDRYNYVLNNGIAHSYAPYVGARYFLDGGVAQNATFFSPNRQISSPVMFGSLPTGVKALKPWQTLLFRPPHLFTGNSGSDHPGHASPPDHLMLDLFWMPVVEPYPISEPFATAGKINMNYQIAPFTYIKRDTGLRAVLKSVKITALNPDQPDAAIAGSTLIYNYKNGGDCGYNDAAFGGDVNAGIGGGYGISVRRNIDLDNTLRQLEDGRFALNKPFISASEICDIPLLPADISGGNYVNAGITKTDSISSIDAKLATFWNYHKLTGDNSLERPYSQIYPRLTTRSNTYTVHLRVQSLKKVVNDKDQNIFKEGKDLVTGDFRGSFVVERYLDPNTQTFDESDASATLGPYKFRVISSKQFGQ